MNTLTYLCEDLITLEIKQVQIPTSEAIKKPTSYQVANYLFSLLSSETIAYLIHRYAPVLTCSVNPTTGLDKSYAELYEESPQGLICLIQSNKLQENLEADILDLYRMYDALEIQVKQLDDYQNGRLNY
jgi:hypothetical protein